MTKTTPFLFYFAIIALIGLATAGVSKESEEDRDSKEQTSRPTPTPLPTIRPTLAPPVVTDEHCDFIKPCGQTCPKHSVWQAGNRCTDDCEKEQMKCDKTMECGCFCTGNYRKKDGVCIHKNCCPNAKLY